jgi:flavodoxin I
MNILVIYDSVFGSTEKIALAIAGALSDTHDVHIKGIGEVSLEDLAGVGLLIAGSPTRQFRATPAIVAFLQSIPADGLKGVKAAAFDTRFDADKMSSKIGGWFVKKFGYAAKPMGELLQKKGAQLVLPPEGFFVDETEGPVTEGELERAAGWALRCAE